MWRLAKLRKYRQGAAEVGDVPGLICVIPQSVSNAILHNVGPETVFIGGDDVAASGSLMGLPIASGEKLGQLDSFEYDASELYGVTAQGVSTVAYLVLDSQ